MPYINFRKLALIDPAAPWDETLSEVPGGVAVFKVVTNPVIIAYVKAKPEIKVIHQMNSMMEVSQAIGEVRNQLVDLSIKAYKAGQK